MNPDPFKDYVTWKDNIRVVFWAAFILAAVIYLSQSLLLKFLFPNLY